MTTFNPEGGQNLNFAMAAESLDKAGPGREPAADGSHTEWLGSAMALEAAKDWEELLDWCRRWTKSEPKNGIAWYGLGNAYGCIGRHYDAMEAYLQAISIDPEHARSWNNLGISYRHLDRYDDAIKAYLRVIRIDPKNGDAWYNLGVAYCLSGNREAALEAVRELQRIDPTGAGELHNLIVRR